MVFVLIAQIPFLEGIPDNEPGDLVGQHRIIPGGHVPQSGVGIQGLAADRHNVGAVLGGGRHLQVQPAQQFAQGTELMAFLGHNEDDPLPLLAEPASHTLEGKGLAGPGGAADPAVAVGVFVIVVWVQEHRRAVIEIQPQEHAVAVAEFVGGEGEGGGHPGG